MAVFSVSTTKSVDDAIKALHDASVRNRFSVLAVHNLKEKLNAKGVAFSPEMRIMELCNPEIAGKALSFELAVSAALPCRISVYEEGTSFSMQTYMLSFRAAGQTKLCMIGPSTMSSVYQHPDLKPLMASVEATLKQIMQESV